MSYQAKIAISLSGSSFVITVKRGQFAARETLTKAEWLQFGEAHGSLAQLDMLVQRVANCCTKIDAQASGQQHIEAEA